MEKNCNDGKKNDNNLLVNLSHPLLRNGYRR